MCFSAERQILHGCKLARVSLGIWHSLPENALTDIALGGQTKLWEQVPAMLLLRRVECVFPGKSDVP